MSKYKIEIEIDVDFDKIFSEIPEGTFSTTDGSDEYYEKECIGDVFKDARIVSLERKAENMFGDKKMAPFHWHHDECAVQVSKQMFENFKITKVDD